MQEGWFRSTDWDADAIERERADVARREGRERMPATAEQLAAYEKWKAAQPPERETHGNESRKSDQ